MKRALEHQKAGMGDKNGGGHTPGGHLGCYLGGYVPPGTPKWHPVLEKISPKIDTPF